MTADGDAPVDDYVDVRDIHPDWRREACWNCGRERWVRRWWRVCKGCFMGQQQHDDFSSDCVTDEGYIDYRLVWYGDVSLEEAKRRYEETAENVTPPRVEERTVRL